VVGRVSTQLGDYYDALHAMKQQELTALAEAHAEDPRRLIRRFHLSVKTAESRAGIDEPFYDSRRKDPGSPQGGEVKSTIAFASYLHHGGICDVKNEEALAFRYIDREIFPGRTKGGVGGSRRSLDLLLANNRDHMPVLAELKIRGDKLAYFALIQVLMHAAEFQSPAQRARLLKHERGNHLSWSPDGPFADLYIIVFATPETGKYRERCFNATKRISELLVADVGFARCVRRIAYLKAFVENGAMAFEKGFAFGPGV
jgi:hypothetical protein